MTRLTRIASTALAMAVVTPAVAFGAAELDLHGAATLRQTADDTAVVTFAVDDNIAGRHKGAVVFGGERNSIRPHGRHGDDYRYQAVFRGQRALDAGARYVVRIEASGHAARTLRLKLIDKR